MIYDDENDDQMPSDSAALNRAVAERLGYEVEMAYGDDDVSASLSYTLLAPDGEYEETLNGLSIAGWDSAAEAWRHAPDFAADLNAAHTLLFQMLDAGIEVEIPLHHDPAQTARAWAELWLAWQDGLKA